MTRKQRLSLLFLFVWMIFIFFMSSFSAEASSSQSGVIVRAIQDVFYLGTTENQMNFKMIEFIVRKVAHFSEYCILGILLFNALDKLHKDLRLTFLLGIIYAVTDEIHQIFIPGRSCQIYDILVDSLGIILGYILINNSLKILKKSVDKTKNKA